MSNLQPAFLRRPASSSSLRTQDESRYENVSKQQSLVEKFSLPPDPSLWSSNRPEPDDELHKPDPRRDMLNDSGSMFTLRALANLGCLAVLFLGIMALFAGYPIITHFTKVKLSDNEGFNTGGLNASGMVPSMPGGRGLIDPETPDSALTRISYNDGKTEMKLIFSDEFNTDGRSFYPGDDPYWEAVDLHYWQTGNLEWYDPAAMTTSNGSLQITLTKKETHGLDYQGGMLASWNQFCFTGGVVEVSVRLPGANNVAGLWPAVWTMGNLGRAGYGASLEGMWPYTYDSCDVGTVANQSHNGVPDVSAYPGDPYHDDLFSFLPGQRLSRCTCPGESHPGPMHDDGTFVGRSAPEIDMFEAEMSGSPLRGGVSQSGQWAPFNAGYEWDNSTTNMIIPDTNLSSYNTYFGGVYQQESSVVTFLDGECYELEAGCYSTYAMEYKPGYAADNGFITWVADDKVAWTLEAAGMAADSRVGIDAKPIPQEPMYIILNLGISGSFGAIDFEHLVFPTTMSVDYVRVYQDPDNINYGCDPDDFPTQSYINEYWTAYQDINLTTWAGDFKQPMPKNSFLGEC